MLSNLSLKQIYENGPWSQLPRIILWLVVTLLCQANFFCAKQPFPPSRSMKDNSSTSNLIPSRIILVMLSSLSRYQIYDIWAFVSVTKVPFNVFCSEDLLISGEKYFLPSRKVWEQNEWLGIQGYLI